MPSENLPLPTCELTVEGRTVTRGHVADDYGTRVQFKVMRGDELIAVRQARTEPSYVFGPETLPGTYTVVLETYKHDGYNAGVIGQFIEISNRVEVVV